MILVVLDYQSKKNEVTKIYDESSIQWKAFYDSYKF